MSERPNDDQTRPRKFFALFVVSSMKWFMIAFPAGFMVMLLMLTFWPNAASTVPWWVVPAVVMAAPLGLGLLSASRQWRRDGTAGAVTELRIGGPMWLFSAVLSRWLYLIALPVFIIAIVLLGTFAPRVLTAIPIRLIPAIGIGVVVLLLGLKLAEGIRQLR